MSQTRQLSLILAEKTMHVKDSKELAKEIAAFLLSEKQTNNLESLVRDVMQIRAERGIVEAVAVSAHPLPDNVISDVRQMIEREYPNAKTVIVNSKIDESVVGGIRIDMANEQLDLSVKAKLNKFKRLVSLERKNA